MSPTLAPARIRATARFAATVDLPTPPLPLATATVLSTPGRYDDWGSREVVTREVMVTSTCSTPGRAATTCLAPSSICFLTGQAGVVSSMANLTLPPSICTSLMKPSETISRWRSGSWILASASSTARSVTISFLFALSPARLTVRRLYRPGRLAGSDQASVPYDPSPTLLRLGVDQRQ